MPGRLAVDFGTSNTVVALWDETLQQGVPLHIPEFGTLEKQGDETISLIPSLIHYAADNRTWIGSQVIQRGLRQSPGTFRWMKRYISHRSPNKVRIAGREITPYIAGQVGEQVSFDPNRHTPISAAIQPQAGQAVTIRFAGATYQGKMIYKAIVE